jgi:hypothetical protein
MMRTLLCVALIISVMTCGISAAQSKEGKDETKEAKIARAMAAGPPEIAKDARIVDQDEHGTETVLREGTNGFTCFPGHPGAVGDDAQCMNAAALRWQRDFLALKPKPTNTEPGIVYMLSGATDWSASDPNATSGNPIKEPPHWMIMWPFDPKTSGFGSEAKQTGTWIMYAGTPWAHLMINQKP